MRSGTLCVLLAAWAVVAGNQWADAADLTWTGGGDGTSWNDAANWGGTAPAFFDTLDITTNATIGNVYRNTGTATYDGGSTWRGIVNLNQGTITFPAQFGSGSNGVFNIGDGAGVADAVVNVSNSGWRFDRHSNGTFTVNVRSDGVLNGGTFQTFAGHGNRKWVMNVDGGQVTTSNAWNMSDGPLNDANLVNISSSGTVDVGAITVHEEVIDFTDLSGSFTAAYGGSFGSFSDVEAAIGSTFTSSSGGVAYATDNGGSFTIVPTTTPHVGGQNMIGTMTLNGNVENQSGGARFVRVLERDGTSGLFHVSEIEVFVEGVTPDEAGPNSTNGPPLSFNDVDAIGYHMPTTTSSIQHGAPERVFDGDHESGGAVWSTNDVADPRFTLDVGGADIGTIRVYPRNDGCCQDRFANLRVEVYADDGSGNPGALLDAFNGPDNAPSGTNAFLEGTVDVPEVLGADIVATLEDTATYIFEIDGTDADRMTIPNPDPGTFTTILDVGNATIQIDLLSDPEPGEVFKLFDVDSIVGTYDDLILPAGIDGSMLLVDGTVTAAIPEPGTLALAALALVGLAGSVRRRRRA